MRTLFFIVITLISVQYISAQSVVSVLDNFPKTIEKGKSYTVNIQIQKDGLLSYAQFNQKFPENTIVKSKQSGGADVVYKNNELTYTWLRTPKESVIELEYEFTISEKITQKNIETKTIFSYIYLNRHGWVSNPIVAEIKPAEKKISTEKPTEIKQTTTVTPTETETVPTTDNSETVKSVAPCVRSISAKNADGSYDVSVTFSFSEIMTAKLIERIPTGSEFSETDMQGAMVKNESGVVSIFWQTTPSKSFTMKYKLKNVSSDVRPQYSGQLITVQNGTIRKYEIK